MRGTEFLSIGILCVRGDEDRVRGVDAEVEGGQTQSYSEEDEKEWQSQSSLPHPISS